MLSDIEICRMRISARNVCSKLNWRNAFDSIFIVDGFLEIYRFGIV